MSSPEDIVQRWKANTSALGIRLTDEDIERIGTSGLLDRLTMVESIMLRTDANHAVPDYLADTRGADSADE